MTDLGKRPVDVWSYDKTGGLALALRRIRNEMYFPRRASGRGAIYDSLQ